MRSAPSDAAVARFRSDVEQLIEADGAALGVAVSGGPDSLALLLLCRAAFPGRCFAATVDHGLRPESAGEADFVAGICGQLAVPHETLTIDEKASRNISHWARRVRYQALDVWAGSNALTCYMTAHHADDQLETMIMRLNRGSGVAGLAGIRARQGKAIRPLLGWRRAELASIVEAAGVVPVCDPANSDDRFDRARLRKSLAGADWLDPIAATQSATALADADAALDWATAVAAQDRIGEIAGGVTLEATGLPAELVRRLVRLCLKRLAPDADPRGEDLSRLISSLASGQTATLAGVRCQGALPWRFTLAPPRRKN